jgi:hypothetical protein
VRWIFPALVEHRRPRYEALVDEYGYAIDASKANRIKTEADFLKLVSAALD